MSNPFIRGDQYIVVDGNPADGFSFVGPFDHQGAFLYRAENSDPLISETSNWIIKLQNPSEDDEDRVHGLATLLAMAEGYDPDKSTPEVWSKFTEEFEGRARTILDSDPWRSDEEADALIRAIKGID